MLSGGIHGRILDGVGKGPPKILTKKGLPDTES